MPHQSVETVRTRIAESARASGRRTDDIHLLAVSKGRSIDDMLRLREAGILDFAENRSSDLHEKARHAALQTVRWHFIGELQPMECAVIAASADVVHSVYREDIADLLSSGLKATNRRLEVFLQVNLARESAKGGVECSHWEEDQTQGAALLALTRHVVTLPGLAVAGLMTIAPAGLPQNDLRTLFARTRALLATARAQESRLGASLSMGMSSDFEVAIEEGATHVRLGSILFD